jgi:DNA polymerase-3 subunit beta
MEFKVNSKELEKHLNRVIPAIPSRTPMPILENFLFDIKDGLLTIYATDLEISLKSSFGIAADGDINALIPAKLLHNVVRALGDTSINFEFTDNGKLVLKTDNGVYTLSFLGTADYPEIPDFPGDKLGSEELQEVTINGEDLKAALDKSVFAIAKEEMRPALTGVLFEFSEGGLRFVATDGHRLANIIYKKYKLDGEEKKQYIVPERAVSVVTKALDEKDVKIYLSATHVSFVMNDMELITRLIAQKYPDYSAVIPLENEFTMKIDANAILDVVKRMMFFSISGTKKIKFSISESKLEISAEDIDRGASADETLACEYNGEPLDIGFNSMYINDILSHLTSEKELVFNLHSPTKAVVITPAEQKEDVEMMMLIMPVRLNS